MEINPAIAAMKYAVDALDSIAEQVTIPKGTTAHEQLREVVALANRADALRARVDDLEDAAKDAARYRFLKGKSEQGAVRTLLPLTRCHYVVVNESAYEHPTFDEAVDAAIEFDAAILSADTNKEGRKDGT